MATITGIDIDASTTIPTLNIGNTNATSINIGTTSANATAITIDKTGNTTTVKGSLILNDTPPGGSTNTSQVGTTAWVQTALTNFKSQAQTWALGQTFTSLITATGGIKTANVDTIAANSTLELGNSNANVVYIGSSGVTDRNVSVYIGTGSGNGRITLGNVSNPTVIPGYLSTDQFFVGGKPKVFPTAQGCSIGWNYVTGGGETSFVNHKFIGTIGGFFFYDKYTNEDNKLLMSITLGARAGGESIGSLNIASITANSGINSNVVDTTSATTLSIGPTNANAITIGSSAKAITIGPLFISADPNLTLNNTSSGAQIYLGNTLVSGGIHIGASQGRTGPIFIGTGGSSTIGIGGTGLTTIGTGGLTSTGLITASGGIKTAIVDTIAAGTLSIGTSISNLVNIAKPGINTAILGTLSVANNITLSTTFTTPTSIQLGYKFSNITCTASTITGNSTYVFCPSTYAAAPILGAGAYIASIQAMIVTSIVPQAVLSVDWHIGIGFGSSLPTSNGEGLTGSTSLTDNNTYKGYNQSHLYKSVSVYFTVPTNNTNAYFGYVYNGIGELSSGTITPTLSIQSIVKIA